jgi:uncharacterized membrane protein
MDVFLGEWVNLLIRWAHLMVSIGWIGTSFYFIALDYSLERRERMQPGVLGTAWQVHGGGFYHVEKFIVAPPFLPERLHWFLWEAYLTWVTGMGLMVVQYYVHARSYLIDPAVFPLETWQAVLLSLASLAAGWAIYDGLCRSPIGEKPGTLAASVFVLIVGAAALYTHVFSGRGAFLHVGALTGTIMAANVFMVIIPNQKKMIAQMLRGEEPDPRYGAIGKQRSLHNNYLTLPVLLMMVAPHYPFLFGHAHAWMVVALILLSGGLVRHYFNRADAGDEWTGYAWAAAAAAFALIATIWVTAPRDTGPVGASVADAEALAIAQKHCVVCHARKPTHESFAEAPKGVSLETVDDLKRYAVQIYAQTVVNRAMPLGNQTEMTEGERQHLGQWVRSVK